MGQPITVYAHRVHRSRDFYFPNGAVLLQKELVVGDWKAEITIGPVPARVREALAASHAVMPYILQSLNSPENPSPPSDAELRATADTFTLGPDWTDSKPLYTTITISRGLDIQPSGDPNSEYLWYDFTQSDVKVWQMANEAEEGDAIDRVTWFLLKQLDPRILGDVLTRPRAFLGTPGKQPCPVPRFNAEAVTASSGRTVSSLSGPLSKLQADDKIPKAEDALTRVSVFTMQQQAEHDPIKKFIAIYSALEAAADGVYKVFKDDIKTKLRVQATADLLVDGLAVEELIWPASESGETNRSIRFRFALMALGLSPESADEDCAAFVAINRYRNRIHGQTEGRADPPLTQASALLQRYYPLVADRLRQ